ncbi:uncharacterized protein A4U43_C07F19950 [Asparagus officinalis]|uniref:Uncharacterized protein n=1 Tax=Asparagus officinalis TaxID=4686 RepID=A0A5P1EF93_ASPOF|nr:uncharacterized protein A4U43_C07F19950 [Asparagus officinalis]
MDAVEIDDEMYASVQAWRLAAAARGHDLGPDLGVRGEIRAAARVWRLRGGKGEGSEEGDGEVDGGQRSDDLDGDDGVEERGLRRREGVFRGVVDVEAGGGGR